jgi:hypothetical protein
VSAKVAAALALAWAVGGAGCRQASEHPAPDSTKGRGRSSIQETTEAARSAAPVTAPASCLAADSLFTYTDAAAHADERTGDVSGTRITLHRASHGWSGTGISLAGPEGIDPTLDSLTVDAAAGKIRFRMPLGFGGYWIVDGRLDCDSLWGTGHPSTAPTERSRVMLHRVLAKQ